MPKGRKTIPVIDVFAGPGGLSEGFSSFASPDLRFSNVLAIEKDPVACSTLRLRSFFRQLRTVPFQKITTGVIRGDAPESILHRYSEWSKASRKVWNAELGKVSTAKLHARIEESSERHQRLGPARGPSLPGIFSGWSSQEDRCRSGGA